MLFRASATVPMLEWPARRFLRRLLDATDHRPLRLTTDKHPAYVKAIRWIVGRKALRQTSQYLNNLTEQSHRPIKQRYYPILGFKNFESASRFCMAYDELRNYLRIKPSATSAVKSSERKEIFRRRWSTLMAELSAC